MSWLSIVLAVLAAACNALSSVLQRKANLSTGDDPFGPGLLLRLVRQPAWLGGFVSMIVSFGLQAVALGEGALATVEPVLVVELPLTLVLATLILHRRPARRDALAAVAMAVGVAVFLGALGPMDTETAPGESGSALLAVVVTAAAVIAIAVAARAGPARARAALLGAAAGAGFGLTASSIKLATIRFETGGLLNVFTGWPVYVVIVAGVASVVLVQAALHAGTLVAAQPGITLLDPLVSVAWGVAVLGETTNTGPVLGLAAAGAVVLILGVLLLARSAALVSGDDAANTNANAAAG